MEEEVEYEVTPRDSGHTTEDRNQPAPGAKAPEPQSQKEKDVAIRQPRHSNRPRADLPIRYRN